MAQTTAANWDFRPGEEYRTPPVKMCLPAVFGGAADFDRLLMTTRNSGYAHDEATGKRQGRLATSSGYQFIKV